MDIKTICTLNNCGIKLIDDGSKLAKEIIRNSDKRWIPILGEGVSGQFAADGGNIKAKLNELVNDNTKKDQFTQNENMEFISTLAGAIQKEDLTMLKSILFGDAWNGITFLNGHREKQGENRKKYAEWLIKADNLNIEFSKVSFEDEKKEKVIKLVNLDNVLSVFPGIILTMCQDETLEAFMEYKETVHVQDNVCTPYSMVTSPKWERKLDSMLKKDKEDYILVKLCGSCNEPNQMLLSKHDFMTYYDSDQNIYTVKFLKEIFKNTNLLFIGIDVDTSKGELVLPEEIGKLLKETVEGTEEITKRYLFPSMEVEKINSFLEQMAKTVSEEEKVIAKSESQEKLCLASGEQVYEEFQKLYSRRPMADISSREIDILKEDILKIDNKQHWKIWDKPNIKLLAMVANNLADFYDLKKSLNITDSGLTRETLKKKIEEKIGENLSSDSFRFYQMLRKYEEGFPAGFFRLMSKDELEVKRYKIAAVQLANRGICVKGKRRKNVHKRVQFADSIMLNTIDGCEQWKRELQENIKRWGSRINESYYFASDAFVCDKNMKEDEIKLDFEKICENLNEILECKNEEYAHYRSLIETEMSQILKIIDELDGERLGWKVRIIYRLFLESRMIPCTEERLFQQFRKMQEKLDELKKEENDLAMLQYQKMMLYYAEGALNSQFKNDEKQKAALKCCKEALKIFNDLKEKNVLKEDVFIVGVQIYLLMSQIYCRMNKITEIECNKMHATDSREQKELLEMMKQQLDIADQLILERKNQFGLLYGELTAQVYQKTGEYYFKIGQYPYALERYYQALKYYELYSQRYEIQKADVLRCMADAIYQKEKSEKCFDYLYKAYMLYRKNIDIHGIADVLQSMGNTVKYECFDVKNKKRSDLFFYKVADELYSYLGDNWSQFVVEESLASAISKKKKIVLVVESK